MNNHFPPTTGDNLSTTASVISDSGSRGWMQNLISRKTKNAVNADQMISLSAMIMYIAHQSGQSEFRIERNLADHFKIANVKVLPANEYDKAIRYLADILPT